MSLIQDAIETVPNFPKEGVDFFDITPLLGNVSAFHTCIEQWAGHLRELNLSALLAPDARGFLFAAPLAYALGVRLIPVRKRGKLPGETIEASYGKEYGEDTLELRRDALSRGERVAVVDDVLATGGTAQAAVELAEQLGAEVVEASFLLRVPELEGEKALSVPLFTLLK